MSDEPAVSVPGHSPAASHLKSIILKASKNYSDPWEKYNIHQIPAERAYRHRYLPQTGSWTIDESIVKIQTTPFDSGAMRNTYRMKKISQLHLGKFKKINWHHAPNYVAKAYKNQSNSWDPMDREKVFSDVRLQYEADFWATKFNSYHPPKAIHFIQCFAVELFQRPGCPVLGCERFIDGHDAFGEGFVKHNSNSGFVDQHEGRMTPQTFSAFSFYESQGNIMVVDIQGVNDLYTDPQVHSINCKFGDADLGVRGMALFFATFERNPLCEFFHLPRFPLSRKQSAKARQHREVMYSHHPLLLENLQDTEPVPDSDEEEIARALAMAAKYATVEVERFRELDTNNRPSAVIAPRDELTRNTARVHLELCLLHFQGRLSSHGEVRFEIEGEVKASTDYASCLFHLAQASCLGYPDAVLSLGRLAYGLGTAFCEGLETMVKSNSEQAKLFYELASYRGSVSASWALGNMYLQERDTTQALRFIRRSVQLLQQRNTAEIPIVMEDACCMVRYHPGGPDSPVMKHIEFVNHETSNKLHVGDTIAVSVVDSDKKHAAKVTRLHTDHSVCVTYEDGSEEVVSLDRIQFITHSTPHPSSGAVLHTLFRVRSGSLDATSSSDVERALSDDTSSCPDYESTPVSAPSPEKLLGAGYDSYVVGADIGTNTRTPLAEAEAEAEAEAADAVPAPPAEPRHVEPPKGDEMGFRPEPFEMFAAFAELLMSTDDDADYDLALDMYSLASQCCAEIGKPKLAMKYAMLAES